MRVPVSPLHDDIRFVRGSIQITISHRLKPMVAFNVFHCEAISDGYVENLDLTVRIGAGRATRPTRHARSTVNVLRI
jgi:hypothetical protein